MITDSILKTKVALPDPGTLKSLLLAFVKKAAEIADAQKKLTDRREALAEALRDIDPSDDKAIGQLSSLRTQVELFPGAIERHTAILEREGRPALVKGADVFEAQLLAALRECAATRLEAIATVLTPIFPGQRNVAGDMQSNATTEAAKSPLYLRVLQLAEEVERSNHAHASQKENWITELPARVEQLLALAGRAESI